MSAAQNFKPRNLVLSQIGQGIIEIVVVVGLSALIILAIVVLSVRSNTNATASSTQDQAARFAQQGLEVIRSARIGSTTTLSYGGSPITWQNFFVSTDVLPEGGTYGQSGHIDDPTCPAGTWCIVFDSAVGSPITVNTRFTRTIYVADTPPLVGKSSCNISPTDFTDVKQFTVVVSWTDSAGDHNSTTTSCITRTDSSTSS